MIYFFCKVFIAALEFTKIFLFYYFLRFYPVGVSISHSVFVSVNILLEGWICRHPAPFIKVLLLFSLHIRVF